MIDRNNVGKIQFYFGIFLIVITIIGTIFIVQDTLQIFEKSLSNQTQSANEALSKLEAESELIHLVPTMLVGNMATQSLILRTLAILLFTSISTLLVLGIILILQGLANQKMNEKQIIYKK